MSNGFSISPRRPIIIHTQGRRFEPRPQSLCPSSSGLTSAVSLDSAERTPSISHCHRHSCLRLWDHSTSPCCSQSDRDSSSLSPLESSCVDSIFSHVHETIKVSQTCETQSELRRAHQFSSHRCRQRSLSRNLHISALPADCVHARRADVLPSFSDPGSVHSMPEPPTPPLQPCRSPREFLHRSLLLSNCLHLLHFRQFPSLRAREPSCGQLQSASFRHSMAQDLQHQFSSSEPFRNHAGLLGPMPFDPHTKGSPNHALQRSAHGILHHSSLPRPPRSHVSSPAPPPSFSPNGGVRRSVHLHKSRQNPSGLGPRRIRPHALKQAPVRLGHLSSLGQSSYLRSPQLLDSTPSRIRLLPVSGPEAQSILGPAPSPLRHQGPSILGPAPFLGFPSASQAPNSNAEISHFIPPALPKEASCIQFGSLPSSLAEASRISLHRAVSPSPSAAPLSTSILGPMPRSRGNLFFGSSTETPASSPKAPSAVDQFAVSSSFRHAQVLEPAVSAVSARWVQCSSSSLGLQSFVEIGSIPVPLPRILPAIRVPNSATRRIRPHGSSPISRSASPPSRSSHFSFDSPTSSISYASAESFSHSGASSSAESNSGSRRSSPRTPGSFVFSLSRIDPGFYLDQA
ncbi:putative movement protein [Plantago mottle virus]|uniref:Putative movement protein n=1 Tax=Plantago mottle virus TaxID=312274 RepID=Q3BD97_9VIRU|nr:putative movement protein [Plantago mottle virus]AAW88525.1 putative movement protein [Plantago mottle virus]